VVLVLMVLRAFARESSGMATTTSWGRGYSHSFGGKLRFGSPFYLLFELYSFSFVFEGKDGDFWLTSQKGTKAACA